MEIKRCPNCNANMEYNRTRRIWECQYCGSVFEADKETKKRQKKTNYKFNEDLFDVVINVEKSTNKQATGGCIRTMNQCMNEICTADGTELFIRKNITVPDEMTIAGTNDHLVRAVYPQIKSLIEEGERIIAYYDKGIFFKGKEYYIITDRKTIFVNNKKIKTVRHEDIHSLGLDDALDMPHWYINCDLDMSIYHIDSNGQMQGALLAMICLFGFEKDENKDRIKICYK